MTTGYIPVKKGMILRIKPLTSIPTSASGTYAIVIYSSDKAFVAASYITTSFSWGTVEQESNNVVKLTVNNPTSGYIRICFKGISSNCFITYDAEMP